MRLNSTASKAMAVFPRPHFFHFLFSDRNTHKAKNHQWQQIATAFPQSYRYCLQNNEICGNVLQYIFCQMQLVCQKYSLRLLWLRIFSLPATVTCASQYNCKNFTHTNLQPNQTKPKPSDLLVFPKSKIDHQHYCFDLIIQKMLPSTRGITDWYLQKSIARSYREINYFFKLPPGHLCVINNQQLNGNSGDEEKNDGMLTIQKGKHISMYIKL